MITARELGQRVDGRRRGRVIGRPGWLSSPTTVWWRTPSVPRPSIPRGQGHRGPEAIAAFYDSVIAANESIRFDIRQSFLCGDEAANVGVIRITFAGGSAVEVDGIYIYRRSPDDKIASLRAFWEPDAIRTVSG